MSGQREVIIIGGGQAGLATDHYRLRQGSDLTILEAAAQPVAAWWSRWDSRKLSTPGAL